MSNEVRNFLRRCYSFFLKKFKRNQYVADKFNFNIARLEANTAKNAIKRYKQNMMNKLSKDNLDFKTFCKLSKLFG